MRKFTQLWGAYYLMCVSLSAQQHIYTRALCLVVVPLSLGCVSTCIRDLLDPPLFHLPYPFHLFSESPILCSHSLSLVPRSLITRLVCSSFFRCKSCMPCAKWHHPMERIIPPPPRAELLQKAKRRKWVWPFLSFTSPLILTQFQTCYQLNFCCKCIHTLAKST